MCVCVCACRLLGRTGRRQHQARDTLAVPEGKDSTPPVDKQPRELPFELWNSCLQSIFLQGNQIKWLPDYLGKLGGLQRLDISG